MQTPRQVVALPGLLCDEVVWLQQVTALADIASIKIIDYSWLDNLTDMAFAVLSQTDGPMDVIGHSMGGRVALELWRHAPERVRSLALLDTGVHGVSPGEAEKRQPLLNLSAKCGMTALANAWLPPMVHPDRQSDERLMGPLRDMVARSTPEQHARQINALLTRTDATDLLATITVPTLVVVGRQDSWSPLAQHQLIADAIPGATLEIIEDCGHMSTVEQPDAVTSILGRWLRDVWLLPSN